MATMLFESASTTRFGARSILISPVPLGSTTVMSSGRMACRPPVTSFIDSGWVLVFMTSLIRSYSPAGIVPGVQDVGDPAQVDQVDLAGGGIGRVGRPEILPSIAVMLVEAGGQEMDGHFRPVVAGGVGHEQLQAAGAAAGAAGHIARGQDAEAGNAGEGQEKNGEKTGETTHKILLLQAGKKPLPIDILSPPGAEVNGDAAARHKAIVFNVFMIHRGPGSDVPAAIMPGPGPLRHPPERGFFGVAVTAVSIRAHRHLCPIRLGRGGPALRRSSYFSAGRRGRASAAFRAASSRTPAIRPRRASSSAARDRSFGSSDAMARPFSPASI